MFLAYLALGSLGILLVSILVCRNIARIIETCSFFHDQKFETIFNDSPIGMAIVGMNHRFIRTNKKYNEILGYDNKELIDRTFMEITHPEDVEKDVNLAESLKRGEIDNYSIEKRYIHKNKKYIWVNLNVRMIKSSNNDSLCFLAMVENLQELKDIESDLHNYLKTLDTSEQISNTGSWFYNVDRQKLLWSNGIYNIYGINKILNDFEMAFSYFKDPAKIKYHFNNLIKYGIPYDEIFEFTKENKNEIYVRCKGEKLSDGNLYGVMQDITEFKRNEEELKLAKENSEKSKNQFLAMMSHEIITPINGMIGMAEILQYTNLDDNQRKYIYNILENGDYLQSLIDELLDLSQIENNKFQIENKKINLKDLFDELFDTYRSKLKDNESIDLKYNYDENIPNCIMGDKKRIKQVLLNLLDNAIKFTNEGEIEFGCVLKESFNNKANIYFYVKDTGIGISDKNKDIIFDSFAQIDKGIDRKYEGSGLGLTICKKIIELLNGKLAVSSVQNVGSTFFFTLTLEICKNNPILKVDRSVKKTNPSKFDIDLKILVADDNIINREVSIGYLKLLGIEPDFAHNGLEVLDMIKEKKYDIIFLDIRMPGMDGVQCFEKMKELFPDKSDRPYVIALTAHAMTEDRSKYINMGMNGYVAKPIRLSSLQNTISFFLDRKITKD